MGNGEMAVRCLKVALQHAPAKYRVSVRVRVRGCEEGGLPQSTFRAVHTPATYSRIRILVVEMWGCDV